jgi:hypothetical protein
MLKGLWKVELRENRQCNSMSRHEESDSSTCGKIISIVETGEVIPL